MEGEQVHLRNSTGKMSNYNMFYPTMNIESVGSKLLVMIKGIDDYSVEARQLRWGALEWVWV